eukprot:CAMPEP_0197194474 /NCGR_PEP_ID=MMETSP1423-20130617/29292_1 /TAXON_ID=476441 /ORGANISM="Pseudo-nitzschia heimii, Strain UNC1101" /LENGTH=58 /DNA_ID=CAMNT_0042647901 /DNA_START=73 /DNA_END=245 /DNA_ORIENTATION=+
MPSIAFGVRPRSRWLFTDLVRSHDFRALSKLSTPHRDATAEIACGGSYGVLCEAIEAA